MAVRLWTPIRHYTMEWRWAAADSPQDQPSVEATFTPLWPLSPHLVKDLPMQDADLLWPLVENILAAQRGRPYPALEDVLRRDPTLGLPPDVRRALLTVAADHDPRVIADVKAKQIESGGETVAFAWCEWPTLPDLEADPYLDIDTGKGATEHDVDTYLRKCHLYQSPTDSDDEHFAEREFVKRVFAPVLGQTGLRNLTAQEEFIDDNGKGRRIDFVLSGHQRYAIEIEGATYHAQPNLTDRDFEDEKRRQRSLFARGYAYCPFSYSEIMSGAARDAFARLCMADRKLAPLVVGAASQASSAVTSAEALTRKLLVWAPERFTQVQRALVPFLARWVAEERKEVVVLNHEAEVGVLNLALSELITCAAFTCQLFDLHVDLPRVVIHTMEPHQGEPPSLVREVLSAYLRAEPPDDRRIDRPMTRAVEHVQISDAMAPLPTYDAVFRVESRYSPSDAQANASIHTLDWTPKARALPCSLAEILARFQGRQPDKSTLDYFARRLFHIPTLKHEQYGIICNLLGQASQLVIMPTAFGKSLCYQLPALLLPGVIFVVSPLRALMRDQMHGLETRGLTCAGSITAEDSKLAKERKMAWLRDGRFRVCYIAPERAMIKTFALELRKCVAGLGAWALAVDEAHCVSEWGHDFRVAYLQLGRFRRLLSHDRPSVPALALTATASQWVAEDICNILEIGRESIVRASSVDREEISLSVHPITIPTEKMEAMTGAKSSTKAEILSELVTEAIPRILHMPRINEDLGAEKAAGTIVFSSYSNSRGKNTADSNLTAIRDDLVQQGAALPEQVRIHTSTQPRVCPACGSADCVRDWETKLYVCRRCSHQCPSLKPLVGRDTDFEEVVRRNQDEFARSEFPVLVATKAYGMGIDKRDIRSIIHYGFADGLEAYVQEMGRAGRDGRHSHAALVYVPPVPECANALKSAAGDNDGRERYRLEPRCVSDPESFKYWKCPYKLARLCDYGLKARNIAVDYKSVASDVERSCRVYALLKTMSILRPEEVIPEAPAEEAQTEGKSSDALTSLQFGLYRLQQIGVVRDWFVDYADGHKRPSVEVRAAQSWTLDDGLSHVRRAIKQLVRDDGAADAAEIDRTIGDLGNEIAAAAESDQIERLLTALVEYVHQSIKGMRYWMLWNEWQYAQPAPSGEAEGLEHTVACRRHVLRRTFDTALRVSDDAESKCGFCDTCRPDLNFDEEHAKHVYSNPALDALTERLPSLLGTFDGDQITDAVDIARANGGLLSLQGQAEQRLEVDPNNVAAMTIAGKCARARGRTDDALFHFMSAFRTLEDGIRDLHTEEYLYKQVKHIDPLKAVDLIDRAGSAFDSVEGRRFVATELKHAANHGYIDRARADMARISAELDIWEERISPQFAEAWEAASALRSHEGIDVSRRKAR